MDWHYPIRILKSFATTIVLMLLAAVMAGCVAVGFVISGARQEIPGFNPREGYFGTNFLNDLFYALSDSGFEGVSLTIVAVLWFIYAFVGTLILSAIPIAVFSLLLHLLWPRKNHRVEKAE